MEEAGERGNGADTINYILREKKKKAKRHQDFRNL